MRKVAIVSFGMSDMIFPMLKNFSVHEKGTEVHLFLLYSQDRKKEGIVNFDTVEVDNGFLPQAKLEEVIGSGVMKYVNSSFKVDVFIYQSFKAKSLKNLNLTRQLFSRLKKFDLIHINGISGVLLQFLPFLEFRKWLITVHDFKQHSGEQTSQSATKLINTVLNRTKSIIIQNRIDYGEIERNHSKLYQKTSYIPFGFLDVYKTFLPEDPRPDNDSDVLFFGRISKYKGVEYLLDAVELLAQKNKFPKVIIAGGGKYDFGIERAKGFTNVKVLNRFIENQELASLIAGTKVIVCPYTDATQSGVLMTSYAFEKPAIATAVGGFKDVVKDGINGFLIPPKQAQPLADTIENILSNTDLQQQLIKNIQDYKDLDFLDWKTIVGQLHTVYKSF